MSCGTWRAEPLLLSWAPKPLSSGGMLEAWMVEKDVRVRMIAARRKAGLIFAMYKHRNLY